MGPAVVQVLLCQANSKVGMVLCVYIESSWFLVSWLVVHFIPYPSQPARPPNSSSLYLPASTQQRSFSIATSDKVVVNLMSSQGAPERLWIYRNRKVLLQLVIKLSHGFPHLLQNLAGPFQLLAKNQTHCTMDRSLTCSQKLICRTFL